MPDSMLNRLEIHEHLQSDRRPNAENQLLDAWAVKDTQQVALSVAVTMAAHPALYDFQDGEGISAQRKDPTPMNIGAARQTSAKGAADDCAIDLTHAGVTPAERPAQVAGYTSKGRSGTSAGTVDDERLISDGNSTPWKQAVGGPAHRGGACWALRQQRAGRPHAVLLF